MGRTARFGRVVLVKCAIANFVFISRCVQLVLCSAVLCCAGQTENTHRCCAMAYSGFTWTPSCSLTAMKYQRYGFVRPKPFVAGERLRARRQLDKNVKGYKDVRKELEQVRMDVRRQSERSVLEDRIIRTTFYKSPIGTRTVKGPGGLFYTEPKARSTFFCMKRV